MSRDKVRNLRLTQAEDETLKRAAHMRHMSVSELLRTLAQEEAERTAGWEWRLVPQSQKTSR